MRRVVQFVLLVCMVLDFVDPWAPGVFFFEGDQLFVDGAMRLGAPKMPKPALAHEPQPAPRVDDSSQPPAQTWSSRGDMLRRIAPLPERQRYASRSSEQSSPPSSSPDAH